MGQKAARYATRRDWVLRLPERPKGMRRPGRLCHAGRVPSRKRSKEPHVGCPNCEQLEKENRDLRERLALRRRRRPRAMKSRRQPKPIATSTRRNRGEPTPGGSRGVLGAHIRCPQCRQIPETLEQVLRVTAAIEEENRELRERLEKARARPSQAQTVPLSPEKSQANPRDALQRNP